MSPSASPEPSNPDRRPISTRNLPFFQRLATVLARARVSANTISILGMLAAAGAAACLLATHSADPTSQRLLFLAAAAGIQLRLLANMLDGMVAIASGTASATGELFNEIPDRISDTLILVAAGYAAGGVPALGWLAACMALFVTYIRAVGKTLGVNGLFHGPMSKSHRMFTLTVACVVLGAVPGGWEPRWGLWGLMAGTLVVIVVGAGVTAVRRLGGVVMAIRR